VLLDESANGLEPEGPRGSGRCSAPWLSGPNRMFASGHLMSQMSLTADHLIAAEARRHRVRKFVR
jgi:hypothetical protein